MIAKRDGHSLRDPMAFPLDAGRLADLPNTDPASLRIAVTPDLGGLMVSRAIRDVFDQRIDRIRRLVGAMDGTDVDLTDAPGVDWHVRQELFVSQYHRNAADWDEGFNPNVRATYESALRTPMADIAAARRRQMELYQAFAELFEHFDAVICPGVSISPFPWRELNPETIDGAPVENYMAWLQLTASLTVVGHPVVALPCGVDDRGMPFGIQVVGRMYGDREVLGIARALEAAFATDPLLARPRADLTGLASTTSECRTLGKSVH